MKLVCVSNPKSRNGAVGRALPRLRDCIDASGVDAVMLDLTADDFESRLMDELGNGKGVTVMGVGGDGTHFSLVNLLHDLHAKGSIDSLPTYALCPMGTGNDVAKSIGQKVGARNLSVAVASATEGAQVRCDLGRVDDSTIFLDMFSAGWDVRVLRIRDRLMAWFATRPWLRRCVSGYVIYAIAAFAALFGKGRWTMTITLDDQPPMTGRFAGVLVNNGPVHAGEFILTPRATMTDGLLDVRCFRNRLTYVLAFVRGWRLWPTFIRGTGTAHHQCRRIRVKGNAPIPTQIDGEQSSAKVQCDISVMPEALTLRVPVDGEPHH